MKNMNLNIAFRHQNSWINFSNQSSQNIENIENIQLLIWVHFSGRGAEAAFPGLFSSCGAWTALPPPSGAPWLRLLFLVTQKRFDAIFIDFWFLNCDWKLKYWNNKPSKIIRKWVKIRKLNLIWIQAGKEPHRQAALRLQADLWLRVTSDPTRLNQVLQVIPDWLPMLDQ